MSFPGGVRSGVSSGQFQAASKQWTFTMALETWAVSHVCWQGVWMVLCTQTTRERRDSVLSRKHFDKRCVSFCVNPWAFHGECDWMYTKHEFLYVFHHVLFHWCYFFCHDAVGKQKSQVLHEFFMTRMALDKKLTDHSLDMWKQGLVVGWCGWIFGFGGWWKVADKFRATPVIVQSGLILISQLFYCFQVSLKNWMANNTPPLFLYRC